MLNTVKGLTKFPAILIVVMLTCLLTACASTTVATSPFAPSAVTPTITSGTSNMTSSSNPSAKHPSTPKRPATPIKIIRMINQVGWALTQNAIIRTTDYGQIWQDVTPNISLGPDARGAFVDSNNAWVAYSNGTNTVTIEHTSNAGQSWQKSTVSEPYPAVLDQPHFFNNQEGWLEVSIDGGSAAGSEKVDILHSLDGGQTWQKYSSLPNGGNKTGISFKDAHHGWATGYDASNLPWLYITNNGGQSWQKQSLSNLPGAGSPNVYYLTSPPVFFGNYGELPVYINGTNNPKTQGMVLYKTNDGGQTWMTDYQSNQAALDYGYPENLYILNQNYAWSDDAQTGVFHMTDNAGIDWINKGHVSLVHGISFIDATNGFALGKDALWRTTDGGQHWSIQNYTIQ